MNQHCLQRWRVLFLLFFLTHVVNTCHLWDLSPYTSSWVFLFSDAVVYQLQELSRLSYKGTALEFIPLTWFLLYSLVSSSSLILFIYAFSIFSFISTYLIVSAYNIFKYFNSENYYYYYYYYYLLIRVVHISASWWSSTGVWLTAILLKSPGLFSVFCPFSIM